MPTGLATRAELARIHGVSKQAVTLWTRDPTFPAPTRPGLWDRAEVAAWRRRRRRDRAERRAAAAARELLLWARSAPVPLSEARRRPGALERLLAAGAVEVVPAGRGHVVRAVPRR